MSCSSAKRNEALKPSTAVRMLRDALKAMWMELMRLNSVGVHAADTPRLNRAARAARVRDALSRAYRDRSPCC